MTKKGDGEKKDPRYTGLVKEYFDRLYTNPEPGAPLGPEYIAKPIPRRRQ